MQTMLLDEATFVALDTETTGLSSRTARLIEVAAVKACRGRVVDRFEVLVNPAAPIPPRIARLTGIQTHMVTHAPLAIEVLPAFLEFLGDAVLVMHNERFDLGIINAELERAGLPELANSSVCTMRLARRLLRGLRSKSLASLKSHFEIEVHGAHRALADAQATFEVFLHLVARYRTMQDRHSVEALLKYQRRTYRKTGRTPANVQHVRNSVLPGVPQSPGVYFMRDKADKLLYIGKAKSLAQRVRSYYAGTHGKELWTRQLVRSVHAITWTETNTELSAILLEHRLRKEHQPSYNRADRGADNRRFAAPPFLRVGTEPDDRRLTVVRHIRDDGAQYFGPFANDRQAGTIVKAFFAVYGETRTPVYDRRYASLRSIHLGGRLLAHGLEAVRTFLQAPREEVLDQLEYLMLASSDACEYERAAQYRDWHGVLTNLNRRRYVTGVPVYDRNAVIIVRRAAVVEVHFVRYGLPVGELVGERPLQPGWDVSVVEQVSAHFSRTDERPKRYSFRESDEIRLLACWLHREQDRATVIPWDEGATPAAFTRLVVDAIHASANDLKPKARAAV